MPKKPEFRVPVWFENVALGAICSAANIADRKKTIVGMYYRSTSKKTKKTMSRLCNTIEPEKEGMQFRNENERDKEYEYNEMFESDQRRRTDLLGLLLLLFRQITAVWVQT